MHRFNGLFFRTLPVIAILMALSLPAVAAKYTATPDKPTEKTSKKADKSESEETECTKADLSRMKKYEEKLEKFSEEVSEGSKKAGEMAENESMRDDYMEIHEDFLKYVKSKDFEEVKQSYKVCEAEMPQPFSDPDFWTP